MNAIEFRKMVFKDAIKGIMKMYKFDENTAKKIVEESGLDWSIKVAPDMVAHCSQEQLVDMIIG